MNSRLQTASLKSPASPASKAAFGATWLPLVFAFPLFLLSFYVSLLPEGQAVGVELAIQLILATLVFVLCLVVAFRSFHSSLFEVLPWFVLLSAAYLLIRPAVMLSIYGFDVSGYTGFADVDVSGAIVSKSVAVGGAAVLAFCVAYWSRLASRLGDRFEEVRLPMPKRGAIFHGLIGVMLIAGLVGRIALVSVKGGLQEFQNLRGLDNAGLGPLWYVAGLTVSASLAYVWAVSTKYATRRAWLDLLVVIGVPTVLFINSRGGFLSLALAFLFLRWRASGTRSVYPLLVATATIVIIWGPVRGLIGVDNSSPDSTVRPSSFSLETDEDLDRLTSSTISLGVTDLYWLVISETPGQAEYQYGKLAWLSLLDLVPRALWRDKTLTGSNYFMSIFFPDMAGTNTVVPGYFGMLYLEGGFLWVVAFSALFGLVAKASYKAAILTVDPRAAAPLFYSIIFANVPNVMQSGLYSMGVSAIWTLAPIFLLMIIVRASGSSRRIAHDSSRILVSTRRS